MACCCFGLAKPHAAPEPLPEAGVRHERTLEAVGSRPLILIEAPPQQTTVVC